MTHPCRSWGALPSSSSSSSSSSPLSSRATAFRGWVVLLLVLVFLGVVQGDGFDNVLRKALSSLNIRGAAIAYYDRSTMSQPLVRGYGRVGSASDALPVTPDTAFMLASLSKVFTASAVGTLLDQAFLNSLDDDICQTVPVAWKRSSCRNPFYPTRPVTWRMLVTHRSSLVEDLPSARNTKGTEVSPTYGPSGGYVDPRAAGNPRCPLEDVQGFYRDILTDKATETPIGNLTVQGGQKLNWYKLAQAQFPNGNGLWWNNVPGSKSVYSNAAVGYVAALVELQTNLTFSEYCRRHLFQPLNMTRTAWFARDLPPSTRLAIPVEYRGGGNRWHDIGDYCYIDYASGQLRTTARDLAQWGKAMLLQPRGTPILWSSKVGKLVGTCQERNANGKVVPDCEVGLGWFLLDNSYKGDEAWMAPFEKFDWTGGIWHDGYEAGVQTQGIVLPAAGVFVFVLINTDLNSDLAAQRLASAVQRAAALHL